MYRHYVELTNLVVLIGSDGYELCLSEYERT